MLKKVTVSLLLTFLWSTIITLVIFAALYLSDQQFRFYGIMGLCRFVVVVNVLFLLVSLPALISGLPSVNNKPGLRLVFYFLGVYIVFFVIFFLSKKMETTSSLEGGIFDWLPYIIFFAVQIFFYMRMVREVPFKQTDVAQ